MLKTYESIEVNRRSLVLVDIWPTSSDTNLVVEIQIETTATINTPF